MTSPEFGAAWLTKAFHTAGTMREDNYVTKITSWKRLHVGGSGPKCLFSVEYEKPDDDLDTTFFSKHPWPLEDNAEQRFLECGIYNFGDVPGGEVNFNVFVAHYVNVPVPKYYFADMNRESTEYICINGSVDFPDPSSCGPDFGPYEVVPAIPKAQDWRLKDEAKFFYFALFKRLGQIFGQSKVGALGPNLENTEWESVGTLARPKRQPGLAKYAREFIEALPQIWPKEVVSKKFLDKFETQMDTIALNSAVAFEYQHDDPKYVGFCHANGNADNAWFYKNNEGVLEAGLLDWGQFGPMTFGDLVTTSLCAADGPQLAKCDDQIVQVFADAYHETGAPPLEISELILRFRLEMMIRCEEQLGKSMQYMSKQMKPLFEQMEFYEHEPTWNFMGHQMFGIVQYHNRISLFCLRNDMYWKTWLDFCKKPEIRAKIQN